MMGLSSTHGSHCIEADLRASVKLFERNKVASRTEAEAISSQNAEINNHWPVKPRRPGDDGAAAVLVLGCAGICRSVQGCH